MHVLIHTVLWLTTVCVCVPVIFQSDLTQDITTSVLWVDNKPHMITLDYTVQVPEGPQSSPELRYNYLYH